MAEVTIISGFIRLELYRKLLWVEI
jgi:hypothetical protein